MSFYRMTLTNRHNPTSFVNGEVAEVVRFLLVRGPYAYLGTGWIGCHSDYSPQQHRVRCAFSDRNLHSRMPLDPTHVRLKLLHACDQWHSSRVSIFLPVHTENCVQTMKGTTKPTQGRSHSMLIMGHFLQFAPSKILVLPLCLWVGPPQACSGASTPNPRRWLSMIATRGCLRSR
jgi:hypothetical protein